MKYGTGDKTHTFFKIYGEYLYKLYSQPQSGVGVAMASAGGCGGYHVEAWQATRGFIYAEKVREIDFMPPEPEKTTGNAAPNRTVRKRLLKSQGKNRLPKRRRTRATLLLTHQRLHPKLTSKI